MKTLHSNYPDDIRMYDDHPSSPFFDEDAHAKRQAEEEAKEYAADELYDRMRDERE